MTLPVSDSACTRRWCFISCVDPLSGWKAYGAALFFGVLTALAFAPVYMLPFAFVGYSIVWRVLCNAQTTRAAFITLWWFGFGQFVAGLYWISIALTVDAEQFGWLVPFALFGLTGLFAIYSGLAGVIYHRLKTKNIWYNLFLFASAWWVSEYARSTLFTGFPWNLAGYSWSFSALTLQGVSLFGIHGLGLLSLLLFALPAAYALRPRPRWPGYVILGVWTALLLFGAIRLSSAHNEYVDGVKIRLVQAAIDQTIKWDPAHQQNALHKHFSLMRSPGGEDVTHFIWSETAMPFPLGENSRWTDVLAQYAPPDGGIITGYVRAEGQMPDLKLWNSITMVKANAKLGEVYDKYQLVPFGEFMPLRSVLPIAKITKGAIDFSRGVGASTVRWQGLPPVSPLICYEGIFPELAVNKSDKPQWLLNITNDAWFGNSSGPYQHLSMIRARAIEQGLPVVRVANNGISALIDPYGRYEAQLGLNEVGVLDIKLPVPLRENTPYNRINDMIILLMVVFMIMVTFSRKYFNN